MRTGLRVGQVAGVPVVLDGGALALAGLLTVVLAVAVLPSAVPRFDAVVYWGAGFGTAGLLLLSLLVHEGAHAVAARRRGLPVAEIAPWPSGTTHLGAAGTDSPTAEAWIAAVGPVASAVLGVAMAAAGIGLGLLDVELPAKVLWWLGAANLLLAGVNLLPGAPLDGGRVLAAVLWRRSGDRLAAARRAARAGRHVGVGAAALGGLQLATGWGGGGPWLLVVAWLLWSAAGAEEARVRAISALAGARVGDVMGPLPAELHGWLVVAAALELAPWAPPPGSASTPPTADGPAPLAPGAAERLAPAPMAWTVVDAAGRRTGLVSLARLRRVPAEHRATTTVASVATPLHQVPTARPDEALLDVVARFRPAHEALLVRGDDGDPLGLLDLVAVARTARPRRRPGRAPGAEEERVA